ncbi:MAG: hypothetical protein J6D06_07790 [Clostridia bacterium]|nr:hypothetical protein [Clostridia bacterium]
MKYIRTEELLEQLKLKNISYEQYLAENEDSFICEDLKNFWKEKIAKCGMSKVDIINKADIGYTYFYSVIGGKNYPSRDTIIKIFIAMGLPLEDCQDTLRLYNWAQLSPKIKRDSIVIFALNHSLSLYKLEEMLEDHMEKSFKS